MKKTPFNKLPIYKAIRGSKLSRRAQNEVLRKLKNLNAECKLFEPEKARTLADAIPSEEWCENYDYWFGIHRDSGL